MHVPLMTEGDLGGGTERDSEGGGRFRLQQTQFTSTSDSFGASAHTQFAEDAPIVPLTVSSAK
jgi:hypothetical protein